MVDSMSAVRTPVQNRKQHISPAKSCPNISDAATEDANTGVPFGGSATRNANSTTNITGNPSSNFLQVPSATTALSASATCKMLGNGTCMDQPNGGNAAPKNIEKDTETEKQRINIVTKARRIGRDMTNNPSVVTNRNVKQNKVVESNPHIMINGKGQCEMQDFDLENHNPSPRLKLLDKIKGLPGHFGDSPNIRTPYICVTPPTESMHEPIPSHQPRTHATNTSTVKSNTLILQKRKLTRQSNVSHSVPTSLNNNNTKEANSTVKSNSTNLDSTAKDVKSSSKTSNGNVPESDISNVCICEVTDNDNTNYAVYGSNACDGESDTAAKTTLSSFFRNAFLGTRRRHSKTPPQNNDRESTPPAPTKPTDTKWSANNDASPVQDGLANALSSMALVTNSSR